MAEVNIAGEYETYNGVLRQRGPRIKTYSSMMGDRLAEGEKVLIDKNGSVINRNEAISRSVDEEGLKNQQREGVSQAVLTERAQRRLLKAQAKYLEKETELKDQRQELKKEELELRKQTAEQRRQKEFADSLASAGNPPTNKKSKGFNFSGLKNIGNNLKSSFKGPKMDGGKSLFSGGLPTVIVLILVLLFLLFLLKPVKTANGIKETKAVLLGQAFTGKLSIAGA